MSSTSSGPGFLFAARAVRCQASRPYKYSLHNTPPRSVASSALIKMRVLLLGGTGNLGSRLLPALLVHEHTVVAFVRSPDKLRSLVSPDLYDQVTIYRGDALDTEAVEDAIHQYDCDAIVNAAGNRMPASQEQILGKIATSVSSAAIRVGKLRGKAIRMWLIGGLGSLRYPGTQWNIQDYLPAWMSLHHRQTEEVMREISTADLKWSLLCVAIMRPAGTSIEPLKEPRGHGLAVGVGSPPAWHDSWLRYIPFVGVYLNLIQAIMSYTTKLEDVADLIAEDLAQPGESKYVGELVGFKDVGRRKLD